MRSGRKGISELVAALVMVIIVVAGAIIVYVYSAGMMGSLQGAQPQQGQYTNQVALEYYDWTTALSPTLQTLKLTLRNVGSGRGVLAAFYVGNGTITTPVTLQSGNCTTATTTALKPQNICIANLAIGMKITAGTAYSVKVVTKDGAVFSYTCVAGQSSGSP